MGDSTASEARPGDSFLVSCLRRAATMSALWLCLTLCGVAFGQAADAGSDEVARRHFETATSYFERGDYESAIAEFDKAYQLSQRPELLFNLYVCHEKVGSYGQAADALERYLELVPGAPKRPQLQARVAKLRERAATQGVAAPAEPLPSAGAERPEKLSLQVAEAPGSAENDDARPLRRNPWLWTAIGLVVIGAATAGVVVASGSDSGGSSDYVGNFGPSLSGP